MKVILIGATVYLAKHTGCAETQRAGIPRVGAFCAIRTEIKKPRHKSGTL